MEFLSHDFIQIICMWWPWSREHNAVFNLGTFQQMIEYCYEITLTDFLFTYYSIYKAA